MKVYTLLLAGTLCICGCGCGQQNRAWDQANDTARSSQKSSSNRTAPGTPSNHDSTGSLPKPNPNTQANAASPQINPGHDTSTPAADNPAGAPPASFQQTAAQTGPALSPGVNDSRELPENADDQALSMRVRDALEQEAATAPVASQIRISSSNGRVTLQGVVGSEQERNAILDTARTVEAVKSINDQIRVARDDLATRPAQPALVQP